MLKTELVVHERPKDELGRYIERVWPELYKSSEQDGTHICPLSSSHAQHHWTIDHVEHGRITYSCLGNGYGK